MASPDPAGDREKIVSKLPGWLRQDLKVRTAQLRIEIQAAVVQGIADWCSLASTSSPVDTSGADSFSTWLPPGQWDRFKDAASDRNPGPRPGRAVVVAEEPRAHGSAP
jgi:chromosome partitioning protein